MNPLTPEQLRDLAFSRLVKASGDIADDIAAAYGEMLLDAKQAKTHPVILSLHDDGEALREKWDDHPLFQRAFMLTRGQIGFTRENDDAPWRLPAGDTSWQNNVKRIIRSKAGGDSDGSGHIVSLDLELGRILDIGQVNDVVDVLAWIRYLFPNLKISLYGHPFNGDADVYEDSKEAARPIYESGLAHYFGPSMYAGRLTDLLKDDARFDEMIDRSIAAADEFGMEVMPNFNQRYVHDHPHVGTQLLPEGIFMEKVGMLHQAFGWVMLWSGDRTWWNITQRNPRAVHDRPMKYGRFMSNMQDDAGEVGLKAGRLLGEAIDMISNRTYERVVKVAGA